MREHGVAGCGPVRARLPADGRSTVVFDGVGYKTLAVEVVAERGLLEEVDA